MTAYVIVDMNVTDQDQYANYRPLAQASIAEAGGRYLVRGGEVEVLEGEAAPNRIVIVEFSDLETARNWYDGPGYRSARVEREGAASATFLLVEGVAAS
jgi:uncharacterized protein (DUF1330 family)